MRHGKLPDRVADQNGSPDLLAAQLSVRCYLVRRSPPSMYPIWDGRGHWCAAGAVHPGPPARAQPRPGFESRPAGLRREGRSTASHRLYGRASVRAWEAATPAAVAVARCGWLIGRALVANRMPRLPANTTAIASCQRPPRGRTPTGVLAGPARDIIGEGRPSHSMSGQRNRRIGSRKFTGRPLSVLRRLATPGVGPRRQPLTLRHPVPGPVARQIRTPGQ
jgi:hypothetical protein